MPRMFLTALVCGACLLLTEGPSGPDVAAQTGAASGESNDVRLSRYFAEETMRIANGCLNKLTTKEAWLAEVPERRRQLAEMLGIAWPLPRPEDRSPLAAEVMGTFDQEFPEGTITVERLHFQSLPGLYVTANLYQIGRAHV